MIDDDYIREVNIDNFSGVLGQHYPADTNDYDLVVEESENFVKIIYSIVVCNCTNGALTFRIYLGRNDAYGVGTALFYNTAIPAYSTLIFDTDSGWAIDDVRRLGVRASAGSSLTFTAFGKRFEGD